MQTVTTKRLKEILRAFKGKEMIVVGDVMLDHFIKGDVFAHFAGGPGAGGGREK